MAGELGSGDRFHLNPVDQFGRSIDPAVLEAAVIIGPRAIAYAERLAADPAIAANLLEECAHAVSRVLRTRQRNNDLPIRDLQAYLFRVFIRRVNKISQKTPPSASSGRFPETEIPTSGNFELRILVDELLRRCDPVTRDMFYRRMQGFSWKEIGKVHRVSAHAAESRFSQALKRVRRRLGLEME